MAKRHMRLPGRADPTKTEPALRGPVRLGCRSQGRPAISRRSSIACASRRGAKKAIGALAASILTAYYMLKDGTPYDDLGSDHFDRRAKAVQNRRLLSRLEKPKKLGLPSR